MYDNEKELVDMCDGRYNPHTDLNEIAEQLKVKLKDINYCGQCGNKVTSADKYCKYCGKQINI